MILNFIVASDGDYRKRIVGDPKDTVFQILISAIIGISAFLGFCVLRPRWPTLYNARKRQKDEAESLPELPRTLFGWIPALWRISEQQVLASAGLDAFVFLSFFKMAIKYLAVAFFFAIIVIKPVHDAYPDPKYKRPANATDLNSLHRFDLRGARGGRVWEAAGFPRYEPDYLWMYLVFAYFFTGLALYLVVAESRRIIEIRQNYLGSQSTITDRTIRLAGIPHELQDEDKIRHFVENLEIGKVDSVFLVRNWKKLDTAVAERDSTLRKLERAKVEHAGRIQKHGYNQSLPTTSGNDNGDEESDRLLEENSSDVLSTSEGARPRVRVWFGWLSLQTKRLDAIDYYEEKLRKLDESIVSMRERKDFPTEPLAFVTMDSVASCQMAVQAVLDASPLQLIATPSPAPIDIAWENTYLPTRQKLARSWCITGIIAALTIFWSILFVPVAGLIDLDRIHQVFPPLGDFLDSHPFAKSLVQTQLPTLVASLLNLAVPYLYSWLSYQQGMISHGDVELSIISKNFFFTFFNFFIIFTALGTASLSLDNFGNKPLRETANELALSLQDLRNFYVNYIILQALGLFPLRLLEFGSVSLYPYGLFTSKTPRERHELIQPPVFTYGLYLPQVLLIFLICIVYSVLRASWQVLLPGLVYFVIGFFVFKYQLLYAMDHQQHSTGRGWIIIVDRIIVGLIIFQVTVAGQLALRAAVKRSVVVVPLIFLTLWFSLVYNQSYKPLMTYIALKSIRRAEHADDDDAATRRHWSETGRRRTVDETRESGLRFINPSLVSPLQPPWISGNRPHDCSNRDGSDADA